MDINQDTPAVKKVSLATLDGKESQLVGVKTCLEILFPDKETRPSLRSFNSWKNKGFFPSVKIGKRVFLDPVIVREALDRRFTIHVQ